MSAFRPFPLLRLLLVLFPVYTLITVAHGRPGAGPSTKGEDRMTTLTVTSPAFAEGKPIPVKYTGDGPDFSPPIQWTPGPEGTVEYVLICDDPDAPTSEPWVHWVIFGIPATVTQLPEGRPAHSLPVNPGTMREGKNSFGKTPYGGPAPPRGHGKHHYFFRVYAITEKITLPAGSTKKQVLEAIKGKVLAEGKLMGTYQR